MDGLDDFMLFNFCEDAREEQERSQTIEYPYQKQYWEEDEKKNDNYWDEDSSSTDDDY